jgi:hypothetical protein
MKRRFVLWICLSLFAALPVAAQQKLYPVRGTIPVQKNPYEKDIYYFIVEKPYAYKLTLGFPTDDQARFMRETDAPIVVLWLRLENLSNKPMSFTTDKFAAKDASGRSYARLTGSEAFDRIIGGKGFASKALGKGIAGVTLGRAGGSGEDGRDEAVRFTLQSGEIPALGMKQGLIYFEGPPDKTFTVNVDLGDLWTKAFPFTNEKPKQ